MGGGGKSVEGVYAYYDCVKEIKSQLKVLPDYIIVPVGTGTTFTGLYLGCHEFCPKTEVIGISVARKKVDELPVINNLIIDFNAAIKKIVDRRPIDRMGIELYDDFLYGGYGNFTEQGSRFVKEVVLKEGIVLDEIYVGKALYGLCRLIDKGELFKNKNILFVNTGGIYNF